MEKSAGAGVCGDESSSRSREAEEAPERLARRIADLEHLIAAERTARTRAENADRLKDEFLARLSHELRTPLSSVLTWCRVLEARCAKDDALLRRGLSAITANAMQQSQMVSGLLDISRIATGKLRLKPVACDLRDLLESALLSHRPIAEAKHLVLLLEPCPVPVRVKVDAMRCGQVLGNLLANAIKFTPERGHGDGRCTAEGSAG